MRFGKKTVNKIIDRVVAAANCSVNFDSCAFEKEVETIREEYLLVDRRISSLPEYTSNIVADFLDFKLSYKDIMEKYHCSQRSLRSLLWDCADADDRVAKEIELRRH